MLCGSLSRLNCRFVTIGGLPMVLSRQQETSRPCLDKPDLVALGLALVAPAETPVEARRSAVSFRFKPNL